MDVERDAPLVFVIVLNRNGREHLEYSLPSILGTRYGNLRVLVVDNGSSDESAAFVRQFPVDLKVNATNRGWSGGNNVGIRQAIEQGAAYIVLANNDIRVDDRWIREAVRVAEADSNIAVVGFDVHEPVPGAGDRDAGFSAASRRWHGVHVVDPAPVGGMAMFVRARVFADLGMIDENFFVYGEENDFQTRARRAGYRVVAIDVPVWHHGQGFFGTRSAWASLLQTENNIQLLVKHGSLADVAAAARRHARRRLMRGRSGPEAPSGVEARLLAGGSLRAIVIALTALIRVAYRLPAIVRRRREDNQRIQAIVRGRRLA